MVNRRQGGGLRFWRVATLMALLAGAWLAVWGQENPLGDAHTTAPAAPPKPKDAPPPIVLQPGEHAPDANTRPLHVDVNLVLVPLTVTDPRDRLVTGLEK